MVSQTSRRHGQRAIDARSRIDHADGLPPNLEQLSAADVEFGPGRYFNLRTLSVLCEASGYEVVKTEGVLLKPVTTGQIEQLGLSPAVLQGLLAAGVDDPELSNSPLLRLKPHLDPA